MAGIGLKRSAREFAGKIMVVTLLGSSSTLLADEVLIDRMIAEINGDVITYSDVLKKMRRGNVVEVAAFPAVQTDPPFEVALQDLINKNLVIQKVEEAGVEMSDDKVEQEITDFLAKKGSNREALKRALDQEGITYEQYAEDFKNSMLIKHFQGRFIVPSIKISAKDVELHYFKMLGSAPRGLKLKLKQIFIELPEDASDDIKESKHQLLETIKTKLNEGMPIGDVAKQFSDAPSGFDLPPVEVVDLSPQFRGEVEKLEVGQHTNPIQTGAGFYIFHLEQKILTDSADFEARRREVEMDLRAREMERETTSWIENQRNTSKIRIIRD